MHTNKAEEAELIDWFLRYEQDRRSPQLLDANLESILKLKPNRKELALVLYHSAKAINQGVYGEDKDDITQARRIVSSHIQKWTSQALKSIDAKTEEVIKPSRTIAHILYGFQILELQPPERFTEAIQKKIQKHLNSFSSGELINCLSSMARLALPLDDQFVRSVVKKIKDTDARSFKPNEALELLHALAIIDAVGLAQKGDKRVNLTKPFGSFLGNSRIREKIATTCEDIACKRRLLDSIYWFQNKDVFDYPKQEDSPSLFESDASTTFNKNGATDLTSSPHPVTGDKIDLKKEFAEKAFYVECDGPTHFLRTSDSHNIVLNGSTIFQTMLATKRNPEDIIIRLPYDVFYQNENNNDLWEDLLLDLDDTEAGGYILSPSGKLISLAEDYNPQLRYEEKTLDDF